MVDKKIIFFLLSLNFILIECIRLDQLFRSKDLKFNSFLSDEELMEITNYQLINSSDPDYFYIPIISSSDIHGHYYPTEMEVRNVSYTQGGLDYLGKYVNIIREEFKDQCLYLDAGDMFQGGTESTETKGEIILDYLNLMNTSACTFGNHEFDYTRNFTEEKVKRSVFPWLAANIYDSIGKTIHYFGDNHLISKVFTFKDPNVESSPEIKIGVVGLALKLKDNQISGKGFEGIKFLEYKEELTAEAENLRAESNVSAVVLLSHIGLECGTTDNVTLNLYKPTDEQEKCDENSDMLQLIKSLDKGVIDAVVTGHAHREAHHFIEGIPVIAPINDGVYANIIYLAFDKKNNYKLVPEQVRIEGPLPICQKVFAKNKHCDFMKPEEVEQNLPLINYTFHHKKIEEEVGLKPIHDKYDAIYNDFNEVICRVIGTDEILNIELNGSFYLGNVIADIETRATGSQIGIVSWGNLRTIWNPGKIRKFKIKDLLPFGNQLCTFVMNGDEVKKMMGILQTGARKYYITHGLKQIMAKGGGDDYHLADVKYFDGYEESELISDKDYPVTINTFQSRGGDDFWKVFAWYKPRELRCDYGGEMEIVQEYLKAQKVVDVRKYMDPKNPSITFID